MSSCSMLLVAQRDKPSRHNRQFCVAQRWRTRHRPVCVIDGVLPAGRKGLIGDRGEPELGQLVRTRQPEREVEGIAKGFIQNAHLPDLRRSPGTVILTVHTRRGIGPSATENLVRKFARRKRQISRSASRKIVQGRNVTQVRLIGDRGDRLQVQGSA